MLWQMQQPIVDGDVDRVDNVRTLGTERLVQCKQSANRSSSDDSVRKGRKGGLLVIKESVLIIVGNRTCYTRLQEFSKDSESLPELT